MNLPKEEAAKILLALDIASQNLAAREFALSLANRLKAELIGLIIEDEDLLVSAQYPFSSEISTGSGSERKLGYVNMERSLRAWSAQMQQELLKQAQQANIKCSFRIFRGHKTEILLEQTEKTALLVFSGSRINYYPKQRIAHTVYILVDENSNLDHSLTIVKQLITEGIDNVFFIDNGNDHSAELISNAIKTLSGTEASIIEKKLQTNLPQQLTSMNKSFPAAVVLVPASHQICRHTQEFRELEKFLSCPVVVVN